MNPERVERVRSIMEKNNLDACLVKGMENIYYLTGFHGSEGMVLVTGSDVVLMTDFRYITYAQEVVRGARIIDFRDRKKTIPTVFAEYKIKNVGFDSAHVSVSDYGVWQDILRDCEFFPLTDDIEGIRRCKEPAEINAIQNAIDVATEAFVDIVGKLSPGMTEREIARELDYAMMCHGAEKPSFETIVASGPRAALPHAFPSDREIRAGETIIFDFGAQVEGYCSDETCTVIMGTIDEKMSEIFSLVNSAKNLAIRRILPGMKIKDLDGLVRSMIADAGYGEYFRHGTGHGVGIAVHEAPSINGVNDGIFEENMVVTIEPGIYLAGIGGVRLEDMVLVRADGAQVLTKIEKDAIQIRL